MSREVRKERRRLRRRSPEQIEADEGLARLRTLDLEATATRFFNTIGIESGRMSSSAPHFQNIPVSRRYLSLKDFIAEARSLGPHSDLVVREKRLPDSPPGIAGRLAAKNVPAPRPPERASTPKLCTVDGVRFEEEQDFDRALFEVFYGRTGW